MALEVELGLLRPSSLAVPWTAALVGTLGASLTPLGGAAGSGGRSLRGFASRLGLSRSRTRPFASHFLHLDELLVVAFTCRMAPTTNSSSFAQNRARMATRTHFLLQGGRTLSGRLHK